MKLIESVPNFSEGRRQEIVQAIVGEAQNLNGVWVLDYSSDPDHNRSVVTLVGEPDPLLEALFNMTKKASELIDLTKHTGEHPRMGATDVIPLIPIMGCSKDECINLSRILGERIGSELSIPVYMYEYSATTPERKVLSDIRKGEFENFPSKIQEPSWNPDFGPDVVHPSAGVVAVGCREALIAFNVNLGTDNLEIANKIARAIRHTSGGYRYVRALGFKLEERGIVQVSMNLTNYKKTPIFRVFETIRAEAARYGVSIVGSEIVGLLPLRAMSEVMEHYLMLENFDSSFVLEKKVLDMVSGESE